METFIREHQSFVMSAFFLAFSLGILAYSLGYTDLQVRSADLEIITKHLGDKTTNLEKKTRDLQVSEEAESVAIRSIPDFLERINSIAQSSNVIIRKLIPDDNDKLKYHIEIFVDYYTFLKFSSALETLNVNIHDLEVRPYKSTSTPPIHFITFSLTPKNDAVPLTGERLSKLRKLVAERDKRNPFQRFAPYPDRGKNVPKFAIELTWVHKLRLISRVAGKPRATIDGTEYGVGDPFKSVEGELTIKSISGTRVDLTKKTKNGVQDYFIKFQRRGKKKRRKK